MRIFVPLAVSVLIGVPPVLFGLGVTDDRSEPTREDRDAGAWAMQEELVAGSRIDATAVPATGTIEGRVNVRRRPARRAADRYPTGIPADGREQPPIPLVVHLDGPVAGPASGDPNFELIQRDSTFHPSLLVVPVGSTIAFPNQDPFFHNVFSYSRPARFDLGRYPQGESKDVTLTKPGYVKVFCEIHNWMRAAILVVENPFHVRVSEDGRFELTGVPAGRHTLVVTGFDQGARAIDVEVPPGQTARVQVDLGS